MIGSMRLFHVLYAPVNVVLTNLRRFCYLWLLIALSACYRVPDNLDPKINSTIQDQSLLKLSNAFPPLTPLEKGTDWGKEMMIASCFAKELDLYRAVSTYKRALILIPSDEKGRRLEVQYDILLCFYFGQRYEEAILAFDKSGLACIDKTFPAYHDLLLVLYECYRELSEPEKQEQIFDLLKKSYPDTAEKLTLSRAIREGDLYTIETFAQGFQAPSYLDDLLSYYGSHKKSVAKAQALNLIPGLGYLYIGQKKSALTAFLLNGLFIAAAVQFFRHKHVAAGIITTGFESGWYFGGIYGAGEEAKYYNERLYERKASLVLNQHNLFPTLMMKYAF